LVPLYYAKFSKGSNGGEYSLTHAEKVALGVWLRVRGDAPGPLFPSRQKRGIGRKQLDSLMKSYCQLAHIDRSKAHMHVLKHSCGTHLSASDPDIVAIQDHLGHKQISNTMLYVQVSSKRREEFIGRLERTGWGRVRR
jgi:site-specific recombinase XerD